jgi:hypothetical protein
MVEGKCITNARIVNRNDLYFETIHVFTTFSSQIRLNIILPSRLTIGPLPWWFQTYILYAVLRHLRPTRPAHLILLDLILQKKVNDEYTL